MEDLSETIAKSLKNLGIDNCFMIGHSMGGYVALMFHELFPELLYGFSLFHSHPFPDTNETIKKRLREIDLVKEGKKDLIAKVNIPNAFAQDNVKKFTKDVDNATQIALKTSEKGIIANLHAMMNRPDSSISLENTEIPFLLIAGKKDNYIDFNSVASQILLPQNSEFCILENSGHMGFIEEKVESLNILIVFIQKHITS